MENVSRVSPGGCHLGGCSDVVLGAESKHLGLGEMYPCVSLGVGEDAASGVPVSQCCWMKPAPPGASNFWGFSAGCCLLYGSGQSAETSDGPGSPSAKRGCQLCRSAGRVNYLMNIIFSIIAQHY